MTYKDYENFRYNISKEYYYYSNSMLPHEKEEKYYSDVMQKINEFEKSAIEKALANKEIGDFID